jgi:Tfp pilus assembly protein PilZ
MTDPEKLAKDPNISVITARLFEMILQMPIIERQNLLKQLEETQEKGKRKAPREKYFKDVDFATKDRVFRGFIHDISADGVLIQTSESLAVGQDITLAFELPHSNEHIKVRGKIARLLPSGGFGVKFDESIAGLNDGKKKEG